MDVLLRPVPGDLLLAAVLTVLAVATLEGQSDGATPAAAVVLAVLSVAPLAVRQRAPVIVTAVIGAALAAYAVAGYGDFPSGAIGLVIALFTVAVLRDRLVAAAAFAGAVVVVVLAYVAADTGVVWSQVAQAGVILLVAWILGASVRRWARDAELAAAAAARAVAEERMRIARELHDVVSHHMSVVSLQAGLAAYVVDTDVPTARQAIRTAGDAGREALGEMRRMLGALRTDDEHAAYRPQPGLAQLDALVDRVRGAGLDVDVSVSGEVRDLPPGPDLCAYRMIQESLTNVLKHAGPARAAVTLEYGPRTFTATVADDGGGGRGDAVPQRRARAVARRARHPGDAGAGGAVRRRPARRAVGRRRVHGASAATGGRPGVSEFPQPSGGREVPPGGAAADETSLRVPRVAPLRRRASEPSGRAASVTSPTSASEEAT